MKENKQNNWDDERRNRRKKEEIKGRLSAFLSVIPKTVIKFVDSSKKLKSLDTLDLF